MTRAKKPPNATRLVEKQRIARAGRRAERLCVWLLRLKGYRVLARKTPSAHSNGTALRVPPRGFAQHGRICASWCGGLT